jgi:hypothetical protein
MEKLEACLRSAVFRDVLPTANIKTCGITVRFALVFGRQANQTLGRLPTPLAETVSGFPKFLHATEDRKPNEQRQK